MVFSRHIFEIILYKNVDIKENIYDNSLAFPRAGMAFIY
jgi:hypothetical protein